MKRVITLIIIALLAFTSCEKEQLEVPTTKDGLIGTWSVDRISHTVPGSPNPYFLNFDSTIYIIGNSVITKERYANGRVISLDTSSYTMNSDSIFTTTRVLVGRTYITEAKVAHLKGYTTITNEFNAGEVQVIRLIKK